jgi:hypothetical protein
MVAGVFAELARDRPRSRFTIGITDDVTGTSLPYDPALDIESPQTIPRLTGVRRDSRDQLAAVGFPRLFRQSVSCAGARCGGGQ